MEAILNCTGCGTEFEQSIEATPSKIPYSIAPVFGKLSIVAPVIGVFLMCLNASVIRSTELYVPWLFLLLLLLVCGIAFAIAAWKRDELYRPLWWIGLFLNLAILLSVILITGKFTGQH